MTRAPAIALSQTVSHVVHSFSLTPMFRSPSPRKRAGNEHNFDPGTFAIADGFTDGGGTLDISNASISAAPEISTWLLFIAGLGGIGVMLRRRVRAWAWNLGAHCRSRTAHLWSETARPGRKLGPLCCQLVMTSSHPIRCSNRLLVSTANRSRRLRAPPSMLQHLPLSTRRAFPHKSPARDREGLSPDR